MKVLCHGLIGFLKQSATVDDVARWFNINWGCRLLEDDVVHIQLLSDEEVSQVLSYAEGSSSKPITKSNPFVALDKWMEVIGFLPPPWPSQSPNGFVSMAYRYKLGTKVSSVCLGTSLVQLLK